MGRGADDGRRRARRFGLRAETIAVWLLRAKGYTILARSFRINGGEIDVIARRGATIAFVEVKARPRLEDAMTAIDHRKRQRISRAARFWLTTNRWAVGHMLRGDAVFIAPRRFPRHAIGAVDLQID